MMYIYVDLNQPWICRTWQTIKHFFLAIFNKNSFTNHCLIPTWILNTVCSSIEKTLAVLGDGCHVLLGGHADSLRLDLALLLQPGGHHGLASLLVHPPTLSDGDGGGGGDGLQVAGGAVHDLALSLGQGSLLVKVHHNLHLITLKEGIYLEL